MYILRPSLDDEARKAFQDRYHGYLINNGAKVTSVNEWGLRELAYEIKKYKTGEYVTRMYLYAYNNPVDVGYSGAVQIWYIKADDNPAMLADDNEGGVNE